ncbi:MAG: ATP-grasp domain-containing protein [Parvularculaceae bacterium]|nr:ATP-grasp domain-containing protein [Parvularculaceae bacterium]
MAVINTLLVANRGEIALRVMKTARRMGLRTVAVASEADANTPHAQFADECVTIGPAPSAQSYLNQAAILEAARATGADAIHPGYGFLSENAGFAQAVADAGLVFVGPPPSAIELMGDKAAAKRSMVEADVPCIPGYQGADQADQLFIDAANAAGFPVMVKAAAGGGGRGMRIVRSPDDLVAALADARQEALSAFGSSDLILEKAVEHARHVEVQVFGDNHGNVIHLGERDCSMQRRHQKIVEEAPSPAVNAELRGRMGAAAVAAAKAVDYSGAGTVEFLLADDGSFYFLEMNTRLQVEHPVTEEITGLDLVELQLRVASDEALGLNQEDISLNGHAIEARLYAENPSEGFLPSTGPIQLWQPADNCRTDAGIETGGAVTPFYDPMVAKVIVHGRSREEACRKLIQALQKTTLFGIDTNRTFLIDMIGAKRFAQGEMRTDDLDRMAAFTQPSITAQTYAIAAVLQHMKALVRRQNEIEVPSELLNWSSADHLYTPYRYNSDEGETNVRVSSSGSGYAAQVGDADIKVTVTELSAHFGILTVDGKRVAVQFRHEDAMIDLQTTDGEFQLTNLLALSGSNDGAGSEGDITAPMHGLVTDVFVNVGQSVTAGQRLALLEAMKMQHEIKAMVDGTITEVRVETGSQVSTDDLMIIISNQTEVNE